MKTLLFILFLFCSFSNSYSQEWVNNEMTEYLRDVTIYDMSVNEGVVWACSNGVIRADESGFKVYQFDTSSAGKLENFEIEFPVENGFREVKSNGKTTYLFNDKRNFIKIEDGYILNITFPFEDENYTVDFEVDDIGRLWVLYSNQGSKISKSDIYYYEGDQINKLNIEMHDMRPEGITFSKKNQFLLMLGPMETIDRHMELWKIDFNKVIETKSIDWGSFIESDEINVYVMGYRDLYVIDKIQSLDLIQKIMLPPQQSHSLYYKVLGDWIYISTDEELKRYDYKTDSLENIKTNYDTEEYFFKNLYLYNDSLLVGENGSHDEIFGDYGKGIRILKIKSTP